MKTITKKICTIAGTAAISFGILALSCKVSNGTANVVYAETPATAAKQLPQDSLAVTQALQNTFRSISTNVLPAVVEVDVTEKTKVQQFNPFRDLPFFNFGDEGSDNEKKYKEYEQSSLGSGFIVQKKGKTYYVLTNNHVAGKASSIKIKLNDEREFEGKLVGSDERMDVALVSFESDDNKITVAKMGDSDTMQQGDIVLALGSPLGYFASVTQGIVSATGRSGGQIGSISDFIQTDAAINRGNSGGPLVNIYGEVIGINTWIASQSGGSQGLGFSIPINNIKSAVSQFIDKGKIAYGWLGVSLMEINDSYKKEMGIESSTSGALAAQIFMESPAMKGGMMAGDFITELNGHKVKNVDQLVREVGNIQAGETATFTVIRNKQTLSLTVKIDERNQDVAANNSKLWPGFIAQELTDEVKKRLEIGSKNVKGIVVSNIQEKSPAAVLSLNNGDIITAVNDVEIKNLSEFYNQLNLNGKKEIWFDVYREGNTVSTLKYKFKK